MRNFSVCLLNKILNTGGSKASVTWFIPAVLIAFVGCQNSGFKTSGSGNKKAPPAPVVEKPVVTQPSPDEQDAASRARRGEAPVVPVIPPAPVVPVIPPVGPCQGKDCPPPGVIQSPVQQSPKQSSVVPPMQQSAPTSQTQSPKQSTVIQSPKFSPKQSAY